MRDNTSSTTTASQPAERSEAGPNIASSKARARLPLLLAETTRVEKGGGGETKISHLLARRGIIMAPTHRKNRIINRSQLIGQYHQ